MQAMNLTEPLRKSDLITYRTTILPGIGPAKIAHRLVFSPNALVTAKGIQTGEFYRPERMYSRELRSCQPLPGANPLQ